MTPLASRVAIKTTPPSSGFVGDTEVDAHVVVEDVDAGAHGLVLKTFSLASPREQVAATTSSSSASSSMASCFRRLTSVGGRCVNSFVTLYVSASSPWSCWTVPSKMRWMAPLIGVMAW